MFLALNENLINDIIVNLIEQKLITKNHRDIAIWILKVIDKNKY